MASSSTLGSNDSSSRRCKQGASHYLVVMARQLSEPRLKQIADLATECGLNLRDRMALSSAEAAHDPALPRVAIQFEVKGEAAELDAFRERMAALALPIDFDISYRPRRCRPKLAVFDMDSTLIQAEVIDELAKAAGVGEFVSGVTAAAMRGELDFKQSFSRRVALLAGLTQPQLERVRDGIQLSEGAERLFRGLRSIGCATAVLSGGFVFMAEHLRARLQIDHIHANELPIEDGVVKGSVGKEIVDSRRKEELLKTLALDLEIDLADTVAVGDGANDLLMINAAGTGIAFHAKPVVKASAKHSISVLGLDAVLYLLGISDEAAGNS